MPVDIARGETPEEKFHRMWAADLLSRVSLHLKSECHAKGHDVHYDLFEARILKPALGGESAPHLAELAQEFGITSKQASNLIVTARRAYQRLLWEEIRLYVESDEEAAIELQELFNSLSEK